MCTTTSAIQPSDRFRQWVAEFGVTRLAGELGIQRTTVHSWTHPERPHTPRPLLARQILELSSRHPRSTGQLGWSDVYGPGPAIMLERCRR